MRRALLFSVILAGELGLVYPIALLLFAMGNDAPPPPWLPALFLLAGAAVILLLPRLFPAWGEGNWALAVTLGSGAVALLAGPLALHPGVVSGLTLGVAWWRGTRAASYGLNTEAVPGGVFGLAGMAAALLLVQATLQVPGWNRPATPYLLLLFLAGLTALLLSGVEELRRRWQNAGQAPPVRALAGTAGFLLVMALLLWLVAGSGYTTLGPPAAALLGQITDAALWLLGLVAWLLEPLLRLIALLLRRTAPSPAAGAAGGASLPFGETPAWLLRLLLSIALLGLLALLAAAAYWSLRRRSRSLANPPVREERESTFAWSKLHRRPAPTGAAPAPAAPLGNGPGDRARQLYRRLQRAGAAAGRPRTAAETPQEYMAALHTASPLPPAAVAAITLLYQDVRYGQAVPTDGDLAAGEAAAEQLLRR